MPSVIPFPQTPRLSATEREAVQTIAAVIAHSSEPWDFEETQDDGTMFVHLGPTGGGGEGLTLVRSPAGWTCDVFEGSSVCAYRLRHMPSAAAPLTVLALRLVSHWVGAGIVPAGRVRSGRPSKATR